MRGRLFPFSVTPVTRRIAIATLWAGVVTLALIGATAALGRSLSVIETLRSDAPPAELSRLDSISIARVAAWMGMKPGEPAYEDGMAQNRRMLGKFNRYPATTLLHVVPGLLFMLLVPLQFSRRIRARHIRVHRWSGRVLIVVIVAAGLSGLYFGLRMPFGGWVEGLAVAIFGALMLFAVGRAWIAIRRKDTERHREWMIRMVSIALAISMQRVVAVALAVPTRQGPEDWFAESVWLGFILTAGAGELWIRRTRRRPISPTDAVLPAARVASAAPSRA